MIYISINTVGTIKWCKILYKQLLFFNTIDFMWDYFIVYHNNNGPAIITYMGNKEWYVNNELHREDGPAVDFPSAKEWWINNKQHRLDGPAVEWPSGNKEWYIHGKNYNTELEYWVAVQNYEHT